MTTEIQSILIPKSLYTQAQANTWIIHHNYKLTHRRKGVDVTNTYFRYRQRDPKNYTIKRTIKFGDSGIKAIVQIL